MEFFDFAGADPEEKALALDALSRTETVKFLINNPGPYVPNTAVLKSSYIYTNGERSGEISPPESQHSSMNDSAISNVSSSQEEVSNHHNANGGTSISSYPSSEQTHWVSNATNNNTSRGVDVNSHLDNNSANVIHDSGLYIQQQPHPNNGNTAGGTPVVPYMYHHPLQSTHFYAPPPHPHAAAAAAAAGTMYSPTTHLPINMNTAMSYKDNKRLMGNNHIQNSSTSNSYTKSLGPSKVAGALNSPNCDMQSAFYIPQTQFPEYPAATPVSLPVSGDGSAGLVSDPTVATTNGQAVGIQPTPQSQPYYHPAAVYPPIYQGFSYGGYVLHRNDYPFYYSQHPSAAAGAHIVQLPPHVPPTIQPVPPSVAMPISSANVELSNLSSSSASVPYQQSSNSSQRDTPKSFEEDKNHLENEAIYVEEIDRQQTQAVFGGEEKYEIGGEIYDEDEVYYVEQDETIHEEEENYTLLGEEEAEEALPIDPNQIPDSTFDVVQQMQALTLDNLMVEDINDSQATSQTPSQPIVPSSEIEPEAKNSLKLDEGSSIPNNYQEAKQPKEGGEIQTSNEHSTELKPSPWGNSNKTWASILFAASNEANTETTKIITYEKSENCGDSSNATAATSNGEQKTYITVGNVNARNMVIMPTLSVMPLSPRNRYAFDDTSKIEVVAITEDPMALKLAKRLRDGIHIKHSLPTILPCGLSNRGNWCYVNATLQALLVCPPFYNLMREIGETSGVFRQITSTPIIDNFARHFSHFLPKDYKRQIKGGGNAFIEELLNQETYEPRCIYDSLKHIGMIKNDAQRGKQEDAHEFLLSVLNGLSDEMAKLSSYLEEKEKGGNSTVLNGKSNGVGTQNGHTIGSDDGKFEDEDDTWHEVGTSKYKSMLTRTAKVNPTFISEIFGGSMVEVRTVNKNTTGNREPFMILPLVIKPSNIVTLEDALRWHSRRDKITGYTCSKTKQTVEANCQTFIESLPPILIIQLKLFDYDLEANTESKIMKRIDFSENFEIPRECCSTRDNRACRRYKLLGVVYHDGADAYKGHYLSDVYHLGLNQWVRCDDATLKVISINKIVSDNQCNSNMKPYMLFYRRQDTISHFNKDLASAPISTNSTTLVAAANNGPAHNSSNGTKHHQSNNAHHHSANNNQSHNSSSIDTTINTSNKFSSISRQF